MNRYYILTSRGERRGPYDDEGLRRRYNAGSFNTTTMVQKEGMESWVPITRILTASDTLYPDGSSPVGIALAACWPLRFFGRLARRDFWWAALALFLTNIAVSAVVWLLGMSDMTAMVGGLLSFVWGILFIVIGLSLAWRRLHDTGRSGLWSLLALTVIGGIIVLILCAMKGDEGDNEYGGPPVD